MLESDGFLQAHQEKKHNNSLPQASLNNPNCPYLPVFPCFAGLWCTVLKATNGGLHPPIAEVEAQTPIDDLNTLVSLMKRTAATISRVEEEKPPKTKMLCSSCQVPHSKNCLQQFAMCTTMKGQADFSKRGVSLVDQNPFPWTWNDMINTEYSLTLLDGSTLSKHFPPHSMPWYDCTVGPGGSCCASDNSGIVMTYWGKSTHANVY